MITSVKEQVKIFNARFGYNRVFGLDVDERKAFSEPQAIERFDKVWEDRLHDAVEHAEQISADDARGLLKKTKSAGFVRDDEQQRRFWLESGLFIAQLKDIGDKSSELTQLWFIPSSNPDPRTLYVTFESVEVKQAFCDVAHETGWEPEELGKHLLLQFMETIRHLKEV
jgi:hypothetical protein